MTQKRIHIIQIKINLLIESILNPDSVIIDVINLKAIEGVRYNKTDRSKRPTTSMNFDLFTTIHNRQLQSIVNQIQIIIKSKTTPNQPQSSTYFYTIFFLFLF